MYDFFLARVLCTYLSSNSGCVTRKQWMTMAQHTADIPVVDISQLLTDANPDALRDRDVGQRLVAALRGLGCAVLVNHGIPSHTVSDLIFVQNIL